MKNLRILIITDDEKSSSLAAKVVAENISALKLSANFYYAKSFDEVLNNRDKFLIDGNYDLICLFADMLSIKIYDVVDDILYRHEKSSFSFLSATDHSIEVIEKQDEAQLVFLLNETGAASIDVKEKLRNFFVVAISPAGHFSR